MAGDLPHIPPSPPARSTFRTRHRLTHAREFRAVYDARVRKTRAGLMVFTKPNSLPHHRLGLSIGRQLGNAVVRNRAKRLVREAFRLGQAGWATGPDGAGMDVVVSVRSSRLPTLAGFQKLLAELVAEAAAEWRRRPARGDPPTPPPIETPA